jgi:hypothetical protein
VTTSSDLSAQPDPAPDAADESAPGTSGETAVGAAGGSALGVAEATADAADGEVAVHALEARRIRRPRDMMLSLAVLLVPILVIIAIGRFLYGGSTTATADPETALRAASQASMQPLPVRTAPIDWKIVSAQYKDGVLRIGYLPPSGKGVQLVQGTDAGLISRELGDDARPDGEVEAGGQIWSHWDARNSISALTRKQGLTTIVLLGSASSADLALLAATISR